ncbi:MAG TPA: hypothetical protein VGP19_04235 [Candidatus Acidoferrales bacterium]|jgi:hypothetical protein|nr:hypothetical protein [Candidatus Acidoferrales bacterium]
MKAKISTSVLLAVSMSVTASAQSARPKQDIPTIAKSAKEAIVMQNDDKPISRAQAS